MRSKRSARRMLKKRSRAFCAFERYVLGVGMTVMAFFIERRLLKAIKKGSVEPAARTAGEPDLAPARQGHLTTAPHQVGDQAEG
jgi:hypothetical protein